MKVLVVPRVKLFDRDDVLNKAKNLFWKKGYHATSMQDIVDTLGISRSSLYDTFGGKKQLFDESLKTYCDTNKPDFEAFLQAQPNAKDGFAALFDMLIEGALEQHEGKGCLVVNSTIELSSSCYDTKKIVSDNRTDFEEIFYRFLASCQQKGEISADKDIRNIASAFYVFLSGLYVIIKIESDKDKLRKMSQELLSILD